MTKFNTASVGELPTTHQLNRATLLAAAAAAIILVTTVLPAEYGLDPTGIGSALGLTPMGDMKRAEAATPAAATSAAMAATATPAPTAQPGAPTEVHLTLQPDQGEEVKATMKVGEEFEYRWSTDGAAVNFELHGEPKGAAGNEYTSYEKGTSAGANGKFRAPFDGTHGWYWRNRTDKPITITVSATGQFAKFALVQ
jgi:hypothetical protein